MGITITVEIRQAWGVKRIYPACDTAKVFCEIAGTETFTPRVIELVKQLGYVVKVKATKQETLEDMI